MTGQDCYPTCPAPRIHLRPIPPLQHLEAPIHTLATTGINLYPLAALGLALIAGGIALTRAVRVNRRRPAAIYHAVMTGPPVPEVTQ
jgi:hypothetical protein